LKILTKKTDHSLP